jgi:hypothetical protein
MEEGKQKNISSYFSNLKRNSSSSECTGDGIKDHWGGSGVLNSFPSYKRDKKSEIVKIGDLSNYTINKFFNFTRDESCIKELKSDLKRLELSNKIESGLFKTRGYDFTEDDNSGGSAMVEKFNDHKNSEQNVFLAGLEKGNIEKYFKRGLNRGVCGLNSGVNLMTPFIPSKDQTDRVFSLDHFEFSDSEKKNLMQKVKIKLAKEEDFVNGNNLLPRNIKYEDTKITNWVKYTTYSDLNGINENIFQSILKYLSFKELTKTSLVSKTFLNFYKNTISTYPYFVNIDTSKFNSKKEFTEMLKKTRTLKHIQKLNEIVKNDFGGEKGGPDNFFSKVVVIMSLSSVEDLKYKGTLLESFKIKPKKECFINNFLSNESVANICNSSRFTLHDLSLRGCFKLTNKISTNGIDLCTFLERLELSNNNQIDDDTITRICESCTNLKALNLSNLKLITEKSVRSIGQNLKALEGLDISENSNIKGDSLVSLQNCKHLNRLILNGIKLTDNNLVFIDYLVELKTLSITSKYFRVLKLIFNFFRCQDPYR